MCALEKARHDFEGSDSKLLTLPDVRSLLIGWLHMTTEKRKHFYMQTDRGALDRLEQSVGLPDFLTHNRTSLFGAPAADNRRGHAAGTCRHVLG